MRTDSGGWASSGDEDEDDSEHPREDTSSRPEPVQRTDAPEKDVREHENEVPATTEKTKPIDPSRRTRRMPGSFHQDDLSDDDENGLVAQTRKLLHIKK